MTRGIRPVGNECFSITVETQIFLYGFNVVSKEKSTLLKKKGYFVGGIIDRDADQYVKWSEIPIVTIEQVAERLTNKGEVAIVICIRNAMLHEKIARELCEYGFTKLLYIPMEINREEDLGLRRQMKAYQNFMDNEFERLDNIPCAEANKFLLQDEKGRLIFDDGNWVTFFCDVEDIFIPDREWFANRTPNSYVIKIKEFLFDVPIICSYQHRDLFSFFKGEIEEPKNCINATMKGDMGRWAIYKKDRIALWELMEKWLQYGLFMFALHACPVGRKQGRKYFFIKDGGHRALFLYHHNIFKIPVRASREDYEDYISYAKPEKYVYKSMELLLQEHLLTEADVWNKTVALIGQSDTNRFFEKCGGKVYHWDNDMDIGEASKNVDYIFCAIDESNVDLLKNIYAAKWEKIFLECDKELEIYQEELGTDCQVQLIARALQKDSRIMKVYCIKRKETVNE